MEGTLDLARRITQLLNAHGKVCERLVNGRVIGADTIHVPALCRFGALLTAWSAALWQVPIFGDVDLFSNWNGAPIYMAEQRFVDALHGLQYVRYYEGAGAFADAVKPGGLYENLRLEGQQRMAVGAHVYYPSAATDVTPHLASFLLFREEHWYYFGSTGWMDPDFRWCEKRHPLR